MNDLKHLLESAARDIQLADFTRALNLLDTAASIDPEHPDIAHLKAIIILNQGEDIERARPLIDCAIKKRPNEPVFLNTSGHLWWRTGRFEEALSEIKTAISKKPDYYDAWFNLGNVFRDLGQHIEAANAFKRVLEANPRHTESINALGHIYQLMGHYHNAKIYFLRAIQADPLRVEFHLNLCFVHQTQGDMDSAIATARHALRISSNDFNVRYTLGFLLGKKEEHEEAIEHLKIALEIDPDSTRARFRMGISLHNIGEFEEAVQEFDIVADVIPDVPAVISSRAHSLYRLERLEEAKAGYENVISLSPNSSDGYCNLGMTLRRMGNDSEAIVAFNNALKYHPDNADLHFSKALSLLKTGNFKDGWRHYEWRLHINNKSLAYPARLASSTAIWAGECLKEKTILVLGEQGLGDIVHFCRYMKALKEDGAFVIFSCAPELFRLVDSMSCVDKLIDRTNPAPINVDYYVFLLSLPHVLGTSIESIPYQSPYLHVKNSDIKRWRDQLSSTKINIGISWSGNPRQAENTDRSCSLETLRPIWELDHVQVYSLQKGYGSEQLSESSATKLIIDPTNELIDYYDTASLMKALDLIITIDTSVAHVAGAIGAPVWVILWKVHCWRYLESRIDSPWYPSMKLFRQKSIGNWDEAVANVVDALKSSGDFQHECRAAIERS